MRWVAQSATRAQAQSSDRYTQRINRETQTRLNFYTEHPELISRRLWELEREWDVERWLETMTSSLSIAGLTLALTRSRRWLLLPLTVQGFFLQHAIQGWCPALPVVRRFGVRTQWEIQNERQALLALRRGDKPLGQPASSEQERIPATEL